MPRTLRTVLIPAAGQGTRLLPLTKATPKEMLPLYDRPVLQHAIDEAVIAGAERIVVVLHPSKGAIRDYLSRDTQMELRLRQAGKTSLAEKLSELALPDDVEVAFASQPDALGLGHAISCCRDLVLPGPFGIILPDDVILGRPCLADMAAAYEGGHMVAAMEVSLAETARYGIFHPKGQMRSRCQPASGMVEKPDPEQAPSRLAAVGRYILDPAILTTLRTLAPGSGGEIQLTDAISHDCSIRSLTAYVFAGHRYDCGTLDGLLEASIARRAMQRVHEQGRVHGVSQLGGRLPVPVAANPIPAANGADVRSA